MADQKNSEAYEFIEEISEKGLDLSYQIFVFSVIMHKQKTGFSASFTNLLSLFSRFLFQLRNGKIQTAQRFFLTKNLGNFNRTARCKLFA